MADILIGYDAAGNSLDYTTLAAGISAASPCDRLLVYYSTNTQGIRFGESLTVSKCLSIIGMLGTPFAVSKLFVGFQNTGDNLWDNIAPYNRSAWDIEINLLAGSSGTLTLNRLTMSDGLQVAAVNGATVKVQNSISRYSTGYPFYVASSGDSPSVTWQNCMAIGADGYGFWRGIAVNCVGIENRVRDFSDMEAASDYNVSTDSRAPGANSTTGVKYSDINFLSEADGSLFRVSDDSPLVGAGTTTGQPTTDIYGVTYPSGTIGCMAGIFVERDKSNVLVGAGGTFDEAARNTDPGEVNVLLSTLYKIQNVDKVGSYTPTGPTTPTVTASVLGESVTFTISDSDPTATNTIYTMRRNASAWTSSGSRTGDGTVVASLTSDYYWAYCVSSLGAESISTVISLQTTSDSHTITPEEIIRQRLIASGDVAAVVGEKVFPQAAPQSSALPYIIINGINGNHNQHMEAASGILEASVQVDFYAKRLANAKKLANAARLALDGFSGTVSGLKVHWVHLESDADGFDMPDDGSDEYIRRVTHTYSVWVDESVPTF